MNSLGLGGEGANRLGMIAREGGALLFDDENFKIDYGDWLYTHYSEYPKNH